MKNIFKNILIENKGLSHNSEAAFQIAHYSSDTTF
jgi:hypothetical protein